MRHCLLLGILFWLAGCATVPVGSDESGVSAAADPAALMESGRYLQAAELYLAQAAAAETVPAERSRARLRAANALLLGGDPLSALAELHALNPADLALGELRFLDLLNAELRLADDPQTADELLLSPLDEFPLALHERVLRGRFRALDGRSKPYEAYAALIDLAGYGVQLSTEEQARGAALLGMLDAQSIAALLRRAGAEHPLAAALRARAEELAQQRHAQLAGFDGVYAGDPSQKLAAFAGKATPYGRVALILPLRGAFAQAAAAVRAGVIAAKLADASSTELLLFAVGIEPEQTLRAYDEAIALGAEAVIGPLHREGVDALRQRAQLPIPVLALNTAPGFGAWPVGLSRLTLNPETDLVMITRRLAQIDARRVAIVAASDEALNQATALIEPEIRQRGGRIEVVRFEPGQVDQSKALAVLYGFAPGQARARELSALTGIALRFKPVMRDDLDAVILLADTQSARLLMAQARTYGSLDALLLATSALGQASADTTLNRDLDGLLFPELPWNLGVAPLAPSRGEFYTALSGERPAQARLHALGLDAWRLLPLLDAMRGEPGLSYPGLIGELRLGADGELIREPMWARYRNGQVRPERRTPES